MIEVIVTIVTILGGVVTLLSYFSKEKVRVTICCTESTLLTQKPKIPGITVFVQYEDTIPVENLWRICYTLENTGNKNIIGEGAQSSLVVKGGGLPLYTKNVKKMIQLSATDNNMVELRDNMLHFKQWLPDECITIEALVESSGENPELYIDEHDIINSKVIFKNSTNR
jgi:hypothetical protein